MANLSLLPYKGNVHLFIKKSQYFTLEILRLIDGKINRKLNRAQGVQEEEAAVLVRYYNLT